MKLKSVLGLLLLTFVLQSCNDNIRTPLNVVDTKPPMRAVYSEIQSRIFNAKCTTSGCHGPNEAFPNLTIGNSYSDLTSKKSPLFGVIAIKPGDADNSNFIKKLLGTASGEIMPTKSSGFSTLSKSEIDSIKTWVNNGAINN
ncbi:MAG: hypothetical protein NTW25_13900 [Candidatus Kapabacteria bacterium]|nr:hypothetical protein [Candidatus Kapabacteria bacterium]